ncbi:MAG: hypothetical protein AAGF68_04565 [Pseudomonadota bacterium]
MAKAEPMRVRRKCAIENFEFAETQYSQAYQRMCAKKEELRIADIDYQNIRQIIGEIQEELYGCE